MRQLIIARKDLHMSPGKLAAQVSHASMAFVSKMIRSSVVIPIPFGVTDNDLITHYECQLLINVNEWNNWWNGRFTKTVCEAKNKSQLLKAKALAEEFGLKEGIDFFLIYDACFTELTPEEENGTTLTCIGFRPLDDEEAWKISKKFQLYQ